MWATLSAARSLLVIAQHLTAQPPERIARLSADIDQAEQQILHHRCCVHCSPFADFANLEAHCRAEDHHLHARPTRYPTVRTVEQTTAEAQRIVADLKTEAQRIGTADPDCTCGTYIATAPIVDGVPDWKRAVEDIAEQVEAGEAM
jgi:hypothetical protein